MAVEVLAKHGPEVGFALSVLVFVILGISGILLVGAAYKSLLRNLQTVREGGELSHPVLKRILVDYEDALRKRGARANMSAVVDRGLSDLAPRLPLPGKATVGFWLRMVRMITSVCVALGLLGTFTGLILALVGVSGALARAAQQSGSTSDIVALLTQLRTLIGGMSTAFVASAAGVLGSLILNIWTAVAGTFTKGDVVAGEIEQFLANEYTPTFIVETAEDLQRQMIARLEVLSQTLEYGLANGMGDAAREFSETARSMGTVLKSIEPVTKSLGRSGASLSSMSDALNAVTLDLKNVMQALQVSQEQVPQRMEELRKVEQALVETLGSLPNHTDTLSAGVAHFLSGTRQLENTLNDFHQNWPVIIQQFVTNTEKAVENQTLTVAESIERLREILEQGRRDALEQMEQVVMTTNAGARAAAALDRR